MILSKLRLENFKKYEHLSLEFNEGLIGIIGKNGSGKSTIFEAILFALYGELRNKGYKEVIRNANVTSKDVVLVELDFEFEAFEYRVSREFRGKALSASAKLYKNEDLIASGVKEVSAYIIRLTKMSKDAFIHTLFASQKELTSLSTLKNEDRKKMIRKLLGLEKIDFIEKELIFKARELKREVAAFAEVLLPQEDVEEKTLKEKEYKKEKKEKEETLLILKDEYTNKKEKEKDEKHLLENFLKAKELKQNLFSQKELLQNTIKSHEDKNSKLNKELKILKEKQKELRGLEQVKKEYSSLHNKIKEQEEQKQAFIRKQALLEEQVNLREHYKKSKDSIKILEHETKEHSEFIIKEKVYEKDIEEYKNVLENKTKEEQKLLSLIAGEQRVIDDINKKISNIKNLGQDSDCPTCTRPLLDEYDSVLNSLENMVINSQRDKIDKAKEEAKTLANAKKELEEKGKVLNKEYFDLSKTITLMESKKRDLLKEKEHFEKVQKQGLKNKTELEKLEKYNYIEEIHKELLLKQENLKVKYEYVLSLETMLKRVDIIKEEIKEYKNKIEKLQKELELKEKEYKELIYDKNIHEQKQKDYELQVLANEQKLQYINEQNVQIASIEGYIKTLEESLQNNSKQLLKVQKKKDDLLDYEKIKESLNDFKTKLNEKIAPRISEIASSMYAIITKGKYQLIEVNNDFDFYIYDEGKKFPIERFSGGEVDLANLVLRIAISKTLAELNSTSSIGFLAFDEVFGSQDETRRMEILEAFHTIKEQYRQIFLISHEMEIKEMFESIIEL